MHDVTIMFQLDNLNSFETKLIFLRRQALLWVMKRSTLKKML